MTERWVDRAPGTISGKPGTSPPQLSVNTQESRGAIISSDPGLRRDHEYGEGRTPAGLANRLNQRVLAAAAARQARPQRLALGDHQKPVLRIVHHRGFVRELLVG